jgi:hypothetical protein
VKFLKINVELNVTESLAKYPSEKSRAYKFFERQFETY